jgi:CheY-like chemotaxis protein
MKNKLILVVEDNALNMKLIRSLLQLGHFDVVEANDAESGIELAKKNKPDLILMDIQLPGMDGLQATQIINKDPALKKIPVVALTSYAMQGDEEKSRSAGCVGYITKPINTRNFLDLIKDYLDPDQKIKQNA